MNSLIGIVIPTYNSGKYIESTIRSILTSHLDISVVAVDSGSTDQTLDILKKYNIKTKYAAPGNIYRAINIGLRSVNSVWCTYINSDDLLHLDGYPKDIFFSRDIDLIYGVINQIDKTNNVIQTVIPPVKCLIRMAIRSGFNLFPQPGTVFKKSAYQRLGHFDENFRYSADFDFFLRAVCSNMNISMPTLSKVASFRVHSNQLSFKNTANMRQELESILIKNGIVKNHCESFFIRTYHKSLNLAYNCLFT